MPSPADNPEGNQRPKLGEFAPLVGRRIGSAHRCNAIATKLRHEEPFLEGTIRSVAYALDRTLLLERGRI